MDYSCLYSETDNKRLYLTAKWILDSLVFLDLVGDRRACNGLWVHTISFYPAALECPRLGFE